MKFIRRIALSALMLSSSAFAAWPDKPISIIVPWGCLLYTSDAADE